MFQRQPGRASSQQMQVAGVAGVQHECPWAPIGVQLHERLLGSRCGYYDNPIAVGI